MSPSDRPTFDLVVEPWIPVRDTTGGADLLGIRDVLSRAHELAGIGGDVPTQVFAITRLLLAVLHGALAGPRNRSEWRTLWEADALPSEQIDTYLDRHRDRFDLFHPETPFFQVADLRTAKGETSELSKLIADIPNGVPFFTTRFGGDLDLDYAEAARWLVHCQAFDPSGIKSGAVGDGRVKGGKGYPIGIGWSGYLGGLLLEGSTLRETLLLNLLARDFGPYARDPKDDVPAWEAPPTDQDEDAQLVDRPYGPVDLYTWQSRRIRLFPENGRVRRVLVCNGDPLTPQNKGNDEPHTGWRYSEPQTKKYGHAVYMPREHTSERALWRGLQSILPGAMPHDPKQKFRAAGVVEWLAYLVDEGAVDPAYDVRIRAIGMTYGSQSAVVTDVIDDVLALNAVLTTQGAQRLVQHASEAVSHAEAAVLAVGNLAGDLAAAAGAGQASEGPRQRVMEAAYDQLDQPYRIWLAGLHGDSNPTDELARWHSIVHPVVVRLRDELHSNVPLTAWSGRIVHKRLATPAHADSRFWWALREALPFAFLADSTTTDPVGVIS